MSEDAVARRAFRRMFILLGCFFVLVQINRSAGGVLATYLGEARGFSPTEIGAVMGAMFLAAACAQLPTGIMFDRIGPRRTMTSMGVLALLGMVQLAWAETPLGMFAGRFAIGFGHGGCVTGIYLFAMAWARPDRVAQATTAVVGIAGGLGGVLATTPLALSLERIGMQGAFSGLAAATAVFALLLALFLRDSPERVQPEQSASGETMRETLAGLWEVMTLPALRRIYVMGFCFSAPFMTVGGLWAGPYFIEVQGYGVTGSSNMLLALIVALHVGTFFYGPLERVFSSQRKLILAGVAIEVAALSILALWPGVPGLAAGAALVVFSLAAPFYVALAGHARRFVHPSRTGRMLTCINLTGLIGIFTMQSGTGLLIDLAGGWGVGPEGAYRLVFACVIVVLALCGAIYARQPLAPTPKSDEKAPLAAPV